MGSEVNRGRQRGWYGRVGRNWLSFYMASLSLMWGSAGRPSSHRIHFNSDYLGPLSFGRNIESVTSLTLSQKVLLQLFRIIFNLSRRLLVQIVYCRPISAVNGTLRDFEGVRRELNIIVALLSNIVGEWKRWRDTMRGRGQMCVPGLVSYYVPLWHNLSPSTSCFIHPRFLCLVSHSVPHHTCCSSSRSFLHVLKGQGSEIGRWSVCCLQNPLIRVFFRSSSFVKGTRRDSTVFLSILLWSGLFCKSHECPKVCRRFASCHEDVCLCLSCVWGVIPDRPWLRGQLDRRPDPSRSQLRINHISVKTDILPPVSPVLSSGGSQRWRLVCNHSFCKCALYCPVGLNNNHFSSASAWRSIY